VNRMSRRPRTHPTRRTWTAAAAVTALVGAMLAAPQAAAQPAGPTPADTLAATAAVTADLRPGTHRITLLTGDRVTLTVTTDGRVAVSVTPEVRPDGTVPVLEWYADGDSVYVVPSDAEPLLAAGRLDPTLFDVAYLAAHGFTDTLPVIVEYADDAPGVQALRATGVDTDGRALSSIGARAVEVDADDTAGFWASVQTALAEPAGMRTMAAGARMERVWLDRVAHVVLDESVPLIGAPQAWEVGLDGTGVRVAVLDTGIDTGHPDVAGRIVAARSFVDGDVTDRHGHGTHVATTIAGSGAASGGRYTGVAPRADLVIGKVCTDGGSCPNSAVIAGMEWAVLEQGARVVNLSLGACCTDGTDPLSRAVNELSAATGALFVIAAGNDGPGASTVGSPGAADTALTVAAVTKTGQVAGFSSRGPRVGDSGFKPEIAAPGVGIVAGRAAGTTLDPGQVVDDHYIGSNGTSMATPHVTGAAALLAQQHPDWDGQQVKAALVTSAQDLGHHGYAQGAGQVDLARAVRQPVQVSPAVADFRFVPFPPEGPPMTRTLTYTNPTDEPVTLRLSATLARTTGAEAPADVIALDRDTVTVPARGSATVTVTVDQTGLDAGAYTGAVVATGTTGDLRLRTPVGIVVGEQLHRVELHLTPRSCDNDVHCTGPYSSFSYGFLDVFTLEGTAEGAGAGVTGTLRVPLDEVTPGTTGTGDGYRYEVADDGTVVVTLVLPEGRYALRWEPFWLDRLNRYQYPWFWVPDLVVPRAEPVVFDANRAVKVTHHTPLPTGDGLAATRTYHRLLPDGRFVAWGSANAFGHGNFWGYPTGTVTYGDFVFSHDDVLEAPQVTMAVTGTTPVELHPIYSGYRPAGNDHSTVPVRFPEGTRSLRVVDAGTGEEADYRTVEAAGALVLVRNALGPGYCSITPDQLQRALDAGAAGVLFDAGTCRVPIHIDGSPANEDKPPIPYVALPSAEFEMLAERVAAGPVTVSVTSRHTSPYVYLVETFEHDRVPEAMDYTYPHHTLTTVEASYHARVDGDVTQYWHTFTPEVRFDVGQGYTYAAPMARTEYLAPVGDRYLHHRELSLSAIGAMSNDVSRWDVFTRPGRVSERWNADPWTPGAMPHPPLDGSLLLCAGCREGDLFWPFLHVVGGDGTVDGGTMGWSTSHSGDPDDVTGGVELYRDGEPVPTDQFLGIPVFPVPPDEADYRLVNRFATSGYTVHTEWEFTSGAPTGATRPATGYVCLLGALSGTEIPCQPEPLLFLRYAGLDTDLHHRVPAPGAHRFEVTVHRQPSTLTPPAVTGFTVEVSYDGGTTWESAKVKAAGDGRYTVTVVHPPVNKRPSDAVTLRVEAWDADGNRVRQTITDAYLLAGRGPGQDRCHGQSCVS
jgi:subtilisin family serine protease